MKKNELYIFKEDYIMGTFIKNAGLIACYSAGVVGLYTMAGVITVGAHVLAAGIEVERVIESGYYTLKDGIKDILRKDEH